MQAGERVPGLARGRCACATQGPATGVGRPCRRARRHGTTAPAGRSDARPVTGHLAAALTAKPIEGPEPQHVAAWKAGADGERRVGERLDRWAQASGGFVLHDRRIPGSKANIDHITDLHLPRDGVDGAGTRLSHAGPGGNLSAPQASPCDGAVGSRTVTRRPPAVRGVRVRVPSCARATLSTIAKPRPAPGWSVRARSVPR